ncbi:MAG TPA: DUF4386 domain-containing protein [Candidatus Baltobacteraceae bacterium]|nr:DUF4386 domain-containing protein [Candidatus Baltobacteraceae bacterium]
MRSVDRDARVAGLWYLLLVVLGPFPLVVIPNMIFVPGNAPATAHNIVTHQMLFRAGILDIVICGVLEIFVALALYRLFSGVDRGLAVALAALGIVSVPISFANELNSIGALLSATGAAFFSAFAPAQREATMMLFFNLHHYGNVFNEMFWGLWLLPFGILVYKSGFLPKTLGVWLVLNCFAYVAQSVTGILWPQYIETVENFAFPVQFGEVAIMLWLVIMGARPTLSFAPRAPRVA